jgi:hypothetical protein
MNQALTPHRGALILVLGILGLVICQPVGIAAWVMGKNDLAEMDAGRMDPDGRGLTQAGKICGIVSVCLLALTVLMIMVFMIFSILASRG